MGFFNGLETLDPQVSTKLLLGNLVAWQWFSSRFMRLLAEEYMAYEEQHFVILAAWKSHSCIVVKSSIPGQLVSCQPPIDFLATLKCDYSSVMRPSNQRYLVFIKLLFTILANGKCDFLIDLRASAQSLWQHMCAYSAFSWPINAILGTSWNARLRVHWVLWKPF
jgi:hypothetical protein